MSSIDIDYVKKIARLSRLHITDDETEKYCKQLGDIISYVEQINELDTKNVEPTSHSIPLTNVYRDDISEKSYSRDAMLKNAPETEDSFFKVPQIIEINS